MDLNDLKPTERLVEILHPGTGEPIGIRVSIMSITDERMNKLRRKIQDERLRLETRGKNFKSDDVEENRNHLSFAAMTAWDWYGDITFDGVKPAFNQSQVSKVLTAFPWFRDQVEEAISDEKAFFTPSK